MPRPTSRRPLSSSSSRSSLESDVFSSEDEKPANPSRPTGNNRRNVVYHSLPINGGGAQQSRQALVEDSRQTSIPDSSSYPAKRKSRTCIIVGVCVGVALLVLLAGGLFFFRERLFGEEADLSEDASSSESMENSSSSVESMTKSSISAHEGESNTASPSSTAVPISSSLKSSVGLSTSTVAHASTHIDESPTASSSSIPASSSASSSIDPTQTYSLAKECIGDTFFNCFTSSSTIDAIDAGIASVNGTSAYLRLDSWVDLEQGQDRPMLQLESEISFENALIVIDVPKVPFGCGTKSTLAIVSEGSAGLSLPLLDTSTGQSSISLISKEPGCSLGSKELFTGEAVSKNDDCVGENGSAAGCAVLNPSTYSYGRPWNDANGGIFAFLFDKSGIYIWQFSRSAVPTELDPPRPSEWALPLAAWPTSTCSRDVFKEQTLQILLSACSSDSTWETTSWGGSESCTKAASTCGEFVRKGENVADMVWQFDSLRIYDIE